jgi:hypothetical protein
MSPQCAPASNVPDAYLPAFSDAKQSTSARSGKTAASPRLNFVSQPCAPEISSLIEIGSLARKAT